MPLTKITVMIHDRLLQDFNRQINSLHVKRDAFLDAMIHREVPYLAGEMKGKRLSPKARQYIAGELKRLGTRKVNLQIEKSTAEELNRVAEETNMVRDAFINRLILFLRSGSFILNLLELPEYVTGSAFPHYDVEPMPTSPLRAMEAVQADPLYYLRSASEERHQTGLYLLLLPEKLHGFSCYLEDAFVPGTEDHRKATQEMDEMLQGLFPVEPQAPADIQKTRSAS